MPCANFDNLHVRKRSDPRCICAVLVPVRHAFWLRRSLFYGYNASCIGRCPICFLGAWQQGGQCTNDIAQSHPRVEKHVQEPLHVSHIVTKRLSLEASICKTLLPASCSRSIAEAAWALVPACIWIYLCKDPCCQQLSKAMVGTSTPMSLEPTAFAMSAVKKISYT